MTLKIEVGKFYKTRGGLKVGPMFHSKTDGYFRSENDSGRCWYSDGSRIIKGFPEWQIVSEWVDEPVGPVQEVLVKKEVVQIVETKEKKIVSGSYGYLRTHKDNCAYFGVGYTTSGSFTYSKENISLIRKTAAALNAIADFLEEQNA